MLVVARSFESVIFCAHRLTVVANDDCSNRAGCYWSYCCIKPESRNPDLRCPFEAEVGGIGSESTCTRLGAMIGAV